MYLPSGLSSLYLVGRFGVVILAVGLALTLGGAEGVDTPEAMISFAFNNGDSSVIESARPILNQHDFKGDVYVATDQIGQPGKLSEDDLLALYEDGWGIGSNGVTYQDLTKLNETDLRYELTESKSRLTQIIPEVYGFSVPFGRYTRETLTSISEVYPATVTSFWSPHNDLPMSNGDQNNIMALDINDLSLANVKAIINLMEENQWIVFSLDGLDGNHNWTGEDFAKLADHIASREFVGINTTNRQSVAKK
ncbi:MAG: polysaccharide deacetylase family protein [Bacillota bacterium]